VNYESRIRSFTSSQKQRILIERRGYRLLLKLSSSHEPAGVDPYYLTAHYARLTLGTTTRAPSYISASPYNNYDSCSLINNAISCTPSTAMTAQVLSSELGNLIQESKRKNHDLRNVCMILDIHVCNFLTDSIQSLGGREVTLQLEGIAYHFRIPISSRYKDDHRHLRVITCSDTLQTLAAGRTSFRRS